MKKANNTYKLNQIDFTDQNIQKRLYEVSFAIKVTDSKANAFKVEAKKFVSTLCNHIIEKSPESSERRFHNLLQKLVDCKQIKSSLTGKAKQEFRKFKSNIVRENKAIFRNYDIDKNRLDEFYMEYLKDSTQYEFFCYVVKIVLTMFHGQADEERRFSVNKNLIVENMSDGSLIAYRFVKDHMKCKK